MDVLSNAPAEWIGRIEQKRMRYLAIPLARPPWDTRSDDASQEDGYLRPVAPLGSAATPAGRRPATHVVAKR